MADQNESDQDPRPNWDEFLERCRPYLLAIASKRTRREWRGKLAASDIVQETLIEAAEGGHHVADRTEQDALRWLRRVLANNLHDADRQFHTDKRAVGREVVDGKSGVLRAAPAPQRDRPDEIAVRRERNEALDRAIKTLPDDYQQVILMRHQRSMRFADIAAALGLTENAAQKLWSRAVEALGRRLRESP